MSRPIPTRVYHFTRVEHLSTIVDSGLHCDQLAQARSLLRIEVGNTGIKAGRAARQVPVAPHGCVADYVPFYFATRSPMMYAIHKSNVPGYSEGIDRLVYLGTTVERLAELGLDVLLTDRNAVLAYADFVRWSDGEPADDFIDWPLMKERYWHNTPEEPARLERRMAECLVHGTVPWEAVMAVGARDQAVADEASSIIGLDLPQVLVRPDWYF